MLTPAEEREQLVQIVAKATKVDRVAYGRADCYRIAAAIAPTLSPRQRAWLAGGAFGNARPGLSPALSLQTTDDQARPYRSARAVSRLLCSLIFSSASTIWHADSKYLSTDQQERLACSALPCVPSRGKLEGRLQKPCERELQR
jgi:hypothetical protein